MYISFAIFTRLLNPSAPHFENTMILSIVRRLAMASECCARGGSTQIETAEDLCQRSEDTVFVFPSFLTPLLRCLRQRCRLHHQGRWHDVRFVQIHYRNLNNQHLGSLKECESLIM